jgi:hypothetical protein
MLLVVAGLPGSGKTRLLGSLAAAGRVDAALPDHLTSDRRWAERLPALLDRLRAGQSVAVDGMNFGRRADRRRLRRALAGVPGLRWRWTFFAADRRACLANVLLDAVERDQPWSDHRFWAVLAGGWYAPPPGVRPRPVHRAPCPDGTLEAFLGRYPRCRDSAAAARELLDNAPCPA